MNGAIIAFVEINVKIIIIIIIPLIILDKKKIISLLKKLIQ